MNIIERVTAFSLVMMLLFASVPLGESAEVIDETKGNPEGWSNDVRITNNTRPDTRPAIAAHNDNVYNVWQYQDIGFDDVYFITSSDCGENWDTPFRVSSGIFGIYASTPDIGISGSNISVIWSDNNATAREIKYRTSPDGSQTWLPEKMISSDDGFNSQGPKVAVNNSNVHAIWVDSRFGVASKEIYYKRSTDGGQTWDDAMGDPAQDRRLTFVLSDVSYPNIAINGSNVHVTYEDTRDGSADIYYIRSTDNGVNWDGEQKLTSNGTAHAANTIAVNGSTVHLAWVDVVGGDTYYVYYMQSTDNGINWNSVQQLSGPSTGIGTINLAVSGDNVYAVWSDIKDVTSSEIYYINSTDGGITWDSEILLTADDGQLSNMPKIAVDDSKIHVTWRDNRDSNAEIYYKRYPDFSAADTAPPEIYHDEIASVNISQPTNVTATVTDDIGVDAVYLNYTGVNAINYNVSMTQWNDNWSYDIPGQNNIGNVQYFIWANDTSGNANMTSVYSIPIYDVIAPVINHLPVISANVFNVINITANIIDDVAVYEVFLDYTGVNGTHSNMSMNKWDGNYSFNIPGQASTGIVEYFIWANDTSDNDNMTLVKQIQIYDITKPEINHVPVISKNIGESINITANITDDVAVNKVFLNYTDVHGVNQNITMNKWNGNYSLEIPSQSNSGLVDYFIWANDSSDNDNMTQTYQIQIFDITDPEINHNPITSANVSISINITANVTDDVSVNSVYLNWTGVNGTNYNVSMSKWCENYSYEIPGQDTIGTVQYFIWANDSNGNDNRTIEYSIQINDVVKPVINHVPVLSANVGDATNITVNITDDVGVNKLYLNYTDVEGDNYNVSMNKYNYNWSYDLPGQNNIGIVEYFIWANDTSGNFNQTQTYQIQVNDVVTPEIEHTPVTSMNVSETINTTAQITDDIEVGSVYLNYTGTDGLNHNVSMDAWNGNWSCNIPGQLLKGNLTYFVWANDTSGNANQTDIYQVHITEIIILDTTLPTIISKSPTGVNVSISTTITITFDESMDTSSVENGITISPAIIISSYSWNADNTALTVIPSGNMSYNTTYNVAVEIGAKDIAGNNLASVYSWEFTTELQPVINNPDGGIGEYWWIIIIIVAATMIGIFYYWRSRKNDNEEKPEDEKLS